jgi:hypothetical protein
LLPGIEGSGIPDNVVGTGDAPCGRLQAGDATSGGGSAILPAKSLPMSNGEPPAATFAAAPPLLPEGW